jgi:glyoxylase-like metal-dependent hydrolase (beta-lactamase superfamily II)
LTLFKSLYPNREFLMSYRAFSISISLVFLALTTSSVRLAAEVNKAQEVAPGVWFHEGDGARKGHCNNGWIVFNDYILVVDGNFPSGAIEVLPKIKATSPNPIRFTFDTHHHGDHAYGNQVWFENGATITRPGRSWLPPSSSRWTSPSRLSFRRRWVWSSSARTCQTVSSGPQRSDRGGGIGV